MQSFQRFDKSTTLLIALLVVAFLLATFDVRSAGGGIGTTMREGAQTLFSPLQEVAAAVTRPVVGFIDALSDIASLREENDALRLENEELKTEVEQFASIQADLEHLMEINSLEAPEDLPTVTARIVSSGASTLDLVRFIDKGSNDGISVGDAVIDQRGLIGRVDDVFRNSARVRLIFDPNVTISVQDEVTSQTGLLTGDNDTLILRIFNAEEPVREGNVIVTAGSRFPPGIVVGTVKETAADDAGFGLDAEVVAAMNPTRLDYVKVIVGYSPLDAADDETEEPVTDELVEEPTEDTVGEADGNADGADSSGEEAP
ncbi:MAG: rod shape-determining protein MreC [Acidimicrobiia bacterium]|nr:rod shape-determining protein MreC [Acidimicrobiia bacterium]